MQFFVLNQNAEMKTGPPSLHVRNEPCTMQKKWFRSLLFIQSCYTISSLEVHA